MTSNYQYCQHKVAPVGSSLYYSLLPATPQQKQSMVALHAFETEINEIRFVCSDIIVAKQKLQWWRTEVIKLYAGEPSHPITQALSPSLQTYPLEISLFQTFIDYAENELRPAPFESFDEWVSHHYHAPSMIKVIASQILVSNDSQVLGFAHDLDLALQLTQQILDLRKTSKAGYVFISLADLANHSLQMEELLGLKSSQQLKVLLRVQTQRANDYFKQALQKLPVNLRQSQLSHIILAELQMRLLTEIAADGFNVMEKKISLTPLRKLWITWRVMRRM